MEAAIQATPDGMTLPQWQEQQGIGQSTAYSLLKLVERMAVPLMRTRIGTATKPSVVLEGRSLEAMNRLLAEFRNGKSIKALTEEIDAAASGVAGTPAALAQAEDLDDDAHLDPDEFLKRLQAAQMAQTTGMPLTRRELSWILGSGPTSAFSANAPIRIQKHSSLGWSLLPPA